MPIRKQGQISKTRGKKFKRNSPTALWSQKKRWRISLEKMGLIIKISNENRKIQCLKLRTERGLIAEYRITEMEDKQTENIQTRPQRFFLIK